MPVVRELKREARVVGSLDNDDVGHEVGAELERDRLDHVGALRLVTRERQHLYHKGVRDAKTSSGCQAINNTGAEEESEEETSTWRKR